MSDEEKNSELAELEKLAAEQADRPAVDEGEGKAEETPPGVLVIKQKNEQGDIGVDAIPVGGVEPTEVLTLLEMGIAAFRGKVGLGAR